MSTHYFDGSCVLCVISIDNYCRHLLPSPPSNAYWLPILVTFGGHHYKPIRQTMAFDIIIFSFLKRKNIW
jgi:hypothetical protein